MEKKNIVAIIQARLTSKRFPNKVIQKIGNKYLINMLLERVKKSKKVNKAVLAIPNNKKNTIIKKFLKNQIIFAGVNMMF